MLAVVVCPQRDRWLRCALNDRDVAVRQTAMIVTAWGDATEQAPWPERECLAPCAAGTDPTERRESELLTGPGFEWEYTVEVWRTDGLLIGAYFVTTCAEDDRHARSLALGQAILASSGERGDRFDPERAATFVVEKARRPRGTTRA